MTLAEELLEAFGNKYLDSLEFHNVDSTITSDLPDMKIAVKCMQFFMREGLIEKVPMNEYNCDLRNMALHSPSRPREFMFWRGSSTKHFSTTKYRVYLREAGKGLEFTDPILETNR